MNVIIAGGRDFVPNSDHANWLVEWLIELDPDLVITGGAPGADSFGDTVASHIQMNTLVIPADWKTLGKAAGPIRNKKMAELADLLLVFPGGTGTDNMCNVMALQKKRIIYYDNDWSPHFKQGNK